MPIGTQIYQALPNAATWLVKSAIIATYANWLVTLIKSFARDRSIDDINESTNGIVFITLTLTVAISTVVSAGLRTRGL